VNALRLKIYNVGRGNCILVYFPDGKLGLVDSNIPIGMSECPARDDIVKNGGVLEFVCLTHPHEDHFSGLLSILEDPEIEVKEFWHSMALGLGNILRFHNEYSISAYQGAEFVAEKYFHTSRADELLDIFDYLYYNQSIRFDRKLSEYQMLDSIGGVNLLVLSPSALASNRYQKTLLRAFEGKGRWISIARNYANRISLSLLLSYGQHRIILGGDITKTSWIEIIRGAQKRGMEGEIFPVNCLIASLHGARDSFYRDMWHKILARDGFVVVSCGGGKHPSEEFVENLSEDWEIYCTNKGEYCRNIQRSDNIYPAETYVGLDGNSAEEVEAACCGWIEIEFHPDVVPTVKTEFSPTQEGLYCHRSFSQARTGE